jgi:MOSC domain-containing protein YiiM
VTEAVAHHSLDTLMASIQQVRDSPRDGGRLDLIVRRPGVGLREVLEEGELDPLVGLVGDTWGQRPSKRSVDGGPHPEMQLNLMNATAALLVAAGDPARRALAGDQLYLHLDLSYDNLPPGTRLALGDAVIEVTAEPHRGCAKFSERFGVDAVRFVNSAEGRKLNLRGINAKVVTPGLIRVGDLATKLG